MNDVLIGSYDDHSSDCVHPGWNYHLKQKPFEALELLLPEDYVPVDDTELISDKPQERSEMFHPEDVDAEMQLSFQRVAEMLSFGIRLPQPLKAYKKRHQRQIDNAFQQLQSTRLKRTG